MQMASVSPVSSGSSVLPPNIRQIPSADSPPFSQPSGSAICDLIGRGWGRLHSNLLSTKPFTLAAATAAIRPHRPRDAGVHYCQRFSNNWSFGWQQPSAMIVMQLGCVSLGLCYMVCAQIPNQSLVADLRATSFVFKLVRLYVHNFNGKWKLFYVS